MDSLTAKLEMYFSVLPLPTGNPGLGLFSKQWETTKVEGRKPVHGNGLLRLDRDMVSP